MKLFVALLLFIAVMAGYCLGNLDDESIQESYRPPITLNYVILAMQTARDNHQQYLDDPAYEKWIYWQGSSVKNEKEWIRIYEMVIEILENYPNRVPAWWEED